jgi:uncharacterized protein
MTERVLITGGSGMIGTRLTEMLIEKKYDVSYLSRSSGRKNGIKTYFWDPSNNLIDDEAVLNADYIIHLAGVNVFAERWTSEYKKAVIESRVKSLNLLYGKIKILEQPIKALISSSAIGVYGYEYNERLYDENAPHGSDFLTQVVEHWESAADQLTKLNIRVVKLRTGIVLSLGGGVLKEILGPIKNGIGSPLGSGKQYISWIHIDDLCRAYLKALEDEKMKGAYNAVAPKPVTNEVLTSKVASIVKKRIILPNVPSFALKLILGKERAEVILGGKKVSADKLIKSGFKFEFPDIEVALQDLIGTKGQG